MRSRSGPETPGSLADRFEKQASLQRAVVRDFERKKSMLERLEKTFRVLLADEHFTTLLRAESLDHIPTALLERTRR
jgi:ParB family transcriptional regulator, chromosome partitioning protein